MNSNNKISSLNMFKFKAARSFLSPVLAIMCLFSINNLRAGETSAPLSVSGVRILEFMSWFLQDVRGTEMKKDLIKLAILLEGESAKQFFNRPENLIKQGPQNREQNIQIRADYIFKILNNQSKELRLSRDTIASMLMNPEKIEIPKLSDYAGGEQNAQEIEKGKVSAIRLDNITFGIVSKRVNGGTEFKNKWDIVSDSVSTWEVKFPFEDKPLVLLINPRN